MRRLQIIAIAAVRHHADWGCQEFRAGGRVSSDDETLAEDDGDGLLASPQSRRGRFHSSAAGFGTRYGSFIAASSPGNDHGSGRHDGSSGSGPRWRSRYDVIPVPPPTHGDSRMFLAPGAFECLRRRQAGFGRLGTVDAAQRLGDGLEVLPRRKAHAVADKMDDAWLDNGLKGKTASIASGKPLRPSMTAIRISATPRFPCPFRTRSQNCSRGR